MTMTVLERAVAGDPFKGNQSKFAEAIGTSQQNISNWLRAKKPLPAEYVLRAESATGIPPHVWRPDVYPVPDAQVAA